MKNMKKVCAVILSSAMALSVFGCAKTTKKTGSNGEEWNEEVESEVSDMLKDTSEETEDNASAEETAAEKEPDTVITYGDEGKYNYTITIYGPDGVVTKYEGKTDHKEWEDLLDEMVEAGVFSYVPIELRSESGEWYSGSCGISSVNGQDAGSGYYACYVNGEFKDDFSSVTNIIGVGDNDLVIKYTATNWLPSDIIFMPDSTAVFRMYISTEKETWSVVHAATGYNQAKGVFDNRFRHTLNADQTKTEGTFTDAYWDELIGIIEDLPDLEVYAKTSFYNGSTDGKVIIYLNDNVCVITSDPEGKLVSFLNGYETNPEMTLK